MRNTEIKITSHFDEKEQRTEFFLINFDYINGNDIIAEILAKNYNMTKKEELDGIYFKITSMNNDLINIKLIWHEDLGNYFYSEEQDGKSLKYMRDISKNIVEILQSLFKDEE